MMKKVLNLLAGTKTSGLLFKKKPGNMNLEQLSGIVHVLHATCLPTVCLEERGKRESNTKVIPMYWVKSEW